MKKKKVLIALLLSIFGSYANAQFNKQLTSKEQKAFQIQGDTSRVWQAKKLFFSQFTINENYIKEASAIINYYEIQKQLSEHKNTEKKNIVEETNRLKNEYNKYLCSILFLSGKYLSTPNYQLAFSLRNSLHLSEKTLRNLAQKAIEIKIDEEEKDYWQTEFKELSTILTNEQIDNFLRKKNSQKSWQKAHTAWQFFRRSRKYDTNKDSTAICGKLYSYYSKIAIADELYANDPTLKKEAYAGIKRFAPSIILSIEALQRKQKKQKENISSKHTEKTVSIIKEQYLWAEHSNQSIEEDSKAKRAIMLALGAQGRIDRNTAFTNLSEYSRQGNATAMNAIGLMYLKGYGTRADTIMALSWWEKAGIHGCSDAYNNIGLFYKTEDSHLNLEKAYTYFFKAAEKGNLMGCYFIGYMLYKGLGCEQSYEKAIEYFKIGAKDNYAPSLYMLGLCYRNGYGIEQNETTGKLFLQQAASQSYKQALKELEQPVPENNSYSVYRTLEQKTNQSPTEYPQFEKPSKEIELIERGEYVGSLITYDWSGKYIVSEVPLKLAISSQGRQFTGEWHEGEKESISIAGEIRGNKLIFTDQTKRINGRYKNMAQSFILQEADIQVVEVENEISILGTIQMYSESTKEKERPMYLSITKKNKKTDKSIITAYPNPFTQELNLLINMQNSDKVCLFIYSIKGEPVYQYDAGVVSAGEQHITVYPNLTKGTYIIKVFIGKEENQLTIISK